MIWQGILFGIFFIIVALIDFKIASYFTRRKVTVYNIFYAFENIKYNMRGVFLLILGIFVLFASFFAPQSAYVEEKKSNEN